MDAREGAFVVLTLVLVLERPSVRKLTGKHTDECQPRLTAAVRPLAWELSIRSCNKKKGTNSNNYEEIKDTNL